jgi:D-alanyl-D-alanine carboxypeptidase
MSAATSSAVDRIHYAIQRLIDQGVPGISLTIATPLKSHSHVAGLANIDSNEPILPAHCFGVGSITKVFLSVITHQLIDEGKISLDDTVSDYLKEDVWHGIPNAGKATIGSLMRHQSGIPSWEDDPKWIREGRGAEMEVGKLWKKEETLEYIRYECTSSQAR